jgi:hypothetical protein
MNRKNYIVVQPIKNNRSLKDKNGELITTERIFRIVNSDEYDIMDHIFYMESAEEMKDYMSLYDFCDMMFDGSYEYFEDIDEINIYFHDVNTDMIKFYINVSYDEYGDLDFDIMSLEDSIDFFSGCCGNCYNCEHCK